MPQEEKTALEILVEWFDIIGGLATAAAVFLSWWTIRVMVKQRKQSFQPDLEIENVNHQLFYQILSDNSQTLKDYQMNFWGTTDPTNEVKEIVLVKVVNLGLGVAKFVEFESYYDYEKIIKEIKRIDEKRIYKIKTLGDDEVVISSPFGKYENIFTSKTRQEVKYIQTIPSEKEKTHFSIPNSYFILVTIYLTLIKQNYKLKDKSFLFPDLHIKIRYEDIEEKNFTKHLIGTLQTPVFLESDIYDKGKRIAEFTTIFK